jgi:hypothetical protein
LVYGAALERRFTRKGIQGSNPCPSAIIKWPAFVGLFIMMWLQDLDPGFCAAKEGSVKRSHAQKLASSMVERKRTKSAIPVPPPLLLVADFATFFDCRAITYQRKLKL